MRVVHFVVAREWHDKRLAHDRWSLQRVGAWSPETLKGPLVPEVDGGQEKRDEVISPRLSLIVDRDIL